MLKVRHILAVAVATLALAGLAACGSASPTDGEWFFGDTLALNLQQLDRVQEIRYTDDGRQWVLRPSRDDYEFAVANMDIRNRGATVAILSVQPESLRLRDEASIDYNAVDPFANREEVPESQNPVGGRNPILDKYVPFVWGPVELPQECLNESTGEMQNCRLSGWVVFEVPKDVKLSQLVWETGDYVFVRFKR